MTENVNVPVRVPISLRLPAAIMEEIDSYASKTGIRKTDAFLHFLTLGIESEHSTDDISRFQAVEERLDEILAFVRGTSRTTSDAVLSEVQDAVKTVAAGYPAIQQVFVFGSIARGAATKESDIDLRLVLDRNEKFNLHALEHFCKEVEQKTGRKVDAVTAEEIKNRELAEAIARDRVLVYER